MRVFYSFSLKQDGPFIKRLAAEMAKMGYEPMVPVDEYLYVHNWRMRLAEALRKSDVAVILVTPQNATNPYVMGELWAARVLSQLNRRFVFVPVLLGTDGIPHYVSDLFVANSNGDNDADLGSLATEIDRIIKGNRAFEIAVADIKPRVFIGHGRADDWRRIAGFLEQSLDLVCEEYEKAPATGYTVTARLEQMLATSSLAIIVMSPEDEQPSTEMRARQNVVHEIGLFQGKLGFEKVILLRHKKCESFTNINGINEIQYDSENWESVFDSIRRVAIREGLVGPVPAVSSKPRRGRNGRGSASSGRR